ncbi:MAG: DedA family protein [SAR202 cluster bacterium]|nr:DedA family protein [SAR202 cluster bacterium]
MPASVEHLLLRWVEQVYEALGWPGVVVLMAVESAGVPFPSEVIMSLAGWMLVQADGHGHLHVFLAGLFGAVGNLAGSLVVYALAAKGGRPLLERYGRYLFISRHDLEIADRWFARHGEVAVFVFRLLPVVRTFISIPAGIARMDLLRFSVYTFLGAYPWCLGLAYGGYLMGENWESLRRVMRPFDIPIIVLMAALAGLYLWRHVRRYQRTRRLEP